MQMRFYLVLKKSEFMTFGGKWMEVYIIMFIKIIQAQKDKYFVFSFSCLESRFK